ncbi:MAG: thymidine phosphorylase [Lachnospiraceae bacterium]|nr:thymidine phosphorylase [Lachnospiraceae bacterium]
MNMLDLIIKKKKGLSLSKEEIEYMISSYTAGKIPDYQMSAMLMAICFSGMDDRETADLTMAMTDSGDRLDLKRIDGIKVDKHSTGGVGDKVTLIAAPVAASLGVPVAKMSGRGLGFTGGTIDKLESIPGFRTGISEEEFIRNVNTDGISIMAQTAELAPADKALYALRDVTGTVDSIPLIASSIMSKKIASGSDAIVLDVTVGSGAFMKTEEEARKLASCMVRIGKLADLPTRALITDMDEPLGSLIGNSLEVIEAIEVLKGQGHEDTREVSFEIASQMLIAGGKASDREEALRMIGDCISDGRALKTFRQFIADQGGDPHVTEDLSLLPKARIEEKINSEKDGYVEKIHCDMVGNTVKILGGGRQVKGEEIDPAVGVKLLKKKGEQVRKGEVLAYLYANDENKLKEAQKLIAGAFVIGEEQPERGPLILDIID